MVRVEANSSPWLADMVGGVIPLLLRTAKDGPNFVTVISR